MSKTSRYFINNLADYVSGTVSVPKSRVKTLCCEVIADIVNNEKLFLHIYDERLYVGLSGIAFAFYHLKQQSDFTEDKFIADLDMKYIQQAKSVIKQQKSKNPYKSASYILGSGGFYAVAAAVNQAHGKDYSKYLCKYVELADVLIDSEYLDHGSDELLSGRAGYLSGCLFLQETFGQEIVPIEKIFKIWDCMYKSGVNYSRRSKSQSPLMYEWHDKEYLGAAHGLSGILQMLLSFPSFVDSNPEAERKIKDSVDYLLSLQATNGNFPSSTSAMKRPRAPEDELVHWCHGAPGVVHLMARAYLRWREEKYLQSCLACGEITWEKGLLRKGPGICHGIGGSGYVFLLLYRLTGDDKHLHRAIQFADFLRTDEFKTARCPDRPYSLYEGWAGTAVFLADLMHPKKAHYPFFNVF